MYWEIQTNPGWLDDYKKNIKNFQNKFGRTKNRLIFVSDLKLIIMSKEKLYRSVNGEYLYLFNWIGGGFNDVWAPSKREAYARVMREQKEHEKKYPTHVKLRPDYKSMRKCTYSQYQEQNRMGWMMSM
jgi:hypothetical protein